MGASSQSPLSPSRSIRRRDFLKVAGYGGLAAFLAACGLGSKASNTPPLGSGGLPSSSAAPELEAGPLVIYNWAQYLSDNNVKAFESKFNRQIRVQFFDNNEQMLSVIRAGAKGYDIIVPQDFQVPVLLQANLLYKLDHSLLPNLKNMDPAVLGQAWDKNNDFTIPKDGGATGFFWRKDLISGSYSTWADFVGIVKAHSGKTIILDSPVDILGAAFRATGHSVNDTSAGASQDALNWLLALKPNIKAILPMGDLQAAILNGEGIIALAAAADGLATSKKLPMQFVYAKEGTAQFIDSFAITANSKNPILAQTFMNYMMSPQAAAEEEKTILYSTHNLEAIRMNLIPADLSKFLEFPDDVKPNMEFQATLDANNRKTRDEMWTKFKSA